MSHTLTFGSYRGVASALADELRPRLRGEDRIEVIVPTRSAADSLLARLSDALPTTNLSVHSIETLATRILNEAGRFPRVASEQERQLGMELACRSTDATLAATPGITSMLLRSERDVRDSGIALGELRYRIDSAARLTVRDRLRTIERVWSAASQILRDSGATTLPDVLSEATELVRGGARVPAQVVFGFYDVTGLQRVFLDALAAAGRVAAVYVPIPSDVRAPYHFARPFAEWARERASSERMIDAAAAPPDWTIAGYPSPLRELHEVCRSIRALLDSGVEPSSIAIVARAVDPVEAALLGAMARRFGFALRGLPGRRLSGNRIARGLVDLLLLQERGVLRKDVMEIIRSGARLPDIDDPVPSLDRLETATRRARISRGRADAVRAAEKRARFNDDEPDDMLLRYADIVHSLDRRTHGFGGNRSGSTWSRDLEALIAMFRAETEEDLDAIEALRDLGRALRRPGFAPRRFDARTIARLVDDAGALPTRETVDPVVWFGDVMRFRGLDVGHLFAIRMQHDTVPQRRIEDALLPDADRRILGVRQIGDGRDEEQLLFEIITTGAREAIHFSFASSDSLGRSLRVSSFVKDFVIARRPAERLGILQHFDRWLASAPVPPSAATSLRETEAERRLRDADPALVRALQLVAQNDTETPLAGRVAPGSLLHGRLREVLRRVSPSRLEHLGECPQRFFVTSVLGLREVEDPEPNVQIEIRDKGLLDHGILEELYRGLTEDDWSAVETGDPAKLPASLRARLESVVERQFRVFDQEFPPLNETIRAIERDETVEVLQRFAAGDLAELASTGFRPESFELLLDVEQDERARIGIGPVDAGVRGRVDRVDRHASGAVRVIDYKAGKARRLENLEARIDQGFRLQLPIYALVVMRSRNLGPEGISASIRPLRVDSSSADRFGFGLAERHERLTAMLDLLGRSIFEGRFPAVPWGDACDYCIIRHWCRTANDPRAKARAVRHGSAVRYLEAEAP
jgi:RecB family exonuclease